MQRFARFTVLAAAVALLGACEQEATTGPEIAPDIDAAFSNGLGGHDYQLNIIGVPQGKTADMDDNNGRRIFVLLNGGEEVTNPGGKWKPGQSWDDLDKINKILLQPGPFQVLDANATDDDGALFQLPDPCPDDNDPDTPCDPVYKVTARALGTPGGSAIVTTCADEEGDGFDGSDDVWCGLNGLEIERKRGRSPTYEVTQNLLKLVINVDPDLDPELSVCLGGDDDIVDVDQDPEEHDVWLFDDCFENYFWNYDNNGLKLLQLRFYFDEA